MVILSFWQISRFLRVVTYEEKEEKNSHEEYERWEKECLQMCRLSPILFPGCSKSCKPAGAVGVRHQSLVTTSKNSGRKNHVIIVVLLWEFVTWITFELAEHLENWKCHQIMKSFMPMYSRVLKSFREHTFCEQCSKTRSVSRCKKLLSWEFHDFR